jgi:hypothetical protein
VRRAALKLPPDDSCECHKLWLALEEALAGNPAAAAELLSNTDQRVFVGVDFYGALLAIVQALLQSGHTPDAAAPKAPTAKAARIRLRQLKHTHPEITANRLLRRQYFRALRFLAQQANQPLRAGWCSIRLMFI